MQRFVLAAFLLAISTLAHAQLKHFSLKEGSSRALPKKVVVLPVQVRVSEISAGGLIELVPELTEKASQTLTRAVAAAAGGRKDFELAPFPALSETEQDTVDDFLSTFLVVGSTAYSVTRMGGAAWEHKRTHFDYTLGTGLDFIRERSGADAALIVVGNDYVSSSGRKAMFVLGLALGVGIPMGQSEVATAFVDLKSGDILWIDYRSGLQDLANPEAASQLIGELVNRYPQASN